MALRLGGDVLNDNGVMWECGKGIKTVDIFGISIRHAWV